MVIFGIVKVPVTVLKSEPWRTPPDQFEDPQLGLSLTASPNSLIARADTRAPWEPLR